METLSFQKEIQMKRTVVFLAVFSLLCAAAMARQEQAAAPDKSKLANPAQMTEQAPGKYKVKFDTSKGTFVIEVTRAWAPNGADRFYNLVKNGYYDGCRFFRVVSGFMVQFGIHGNPKLNTVWRSARIPDDPGKQSNQSGFITFATAGPNTRTSQVFINFGDNSGLDKQGFSPFGKVTEGMKVVNSIYSSYGEKPDQGSIQMQGEAYLAKESPTLDVIKSATIVPAAK
jgi:peptidyl-prolyl cis-trans isomerase A (cyclophilin A)